MAVAKQNQVTRMHFTVFDTDGTTPLTGQAGSCTSYLAEDGATASESVTIAEIGSTGHYHAYFTPTNLGTYDMEVTCPDDRVVGENFEVFANDIDVVDTVVDGIVTDIAALNDISAAEVNAECDTALADYDSPTKAEMDTAFAALNDISAAEVNIECDTALADYDGPTKTEMDTMETNLTAEIDANETKIDTIITNQGTASTILGELLDLLENKLTINESGSTLNLWNDAGDAIIKTWPLTDKDGNAIVLIGTDPANRGVRTL